MLDFNTQVVFRVMLWLANVLIWFSVVQQYYTQHDLIVSRYFNQWRHLVAGSITIIMIIIILKIIILITVVTIITATIIIIWKDIVCNQLSTIVTRTTMGAIEEGGGVECVGVNWTSNATYDSLRNVCAVSDCKYSR